jgi:hypothetical protein
VIGEQSSELLDLIPAQVRMLVTSARLPAQRPRRRSTVFADKYGAKYGKGGRLPDALLALFD